MAATSTIPAFRAALLAMLTARLPGVSVCDGPPPPGIANGTEWVALFGTKGRQVVRAMDRVRQPRDETYLQEVQISVVQLDARSDQVVIGERVFELYGELELGIKADVSLTAYYSGPGQLLTVTADEENYETFADDRQRESRLTANLAVHARIS